jgi:integrase/recombinase XerD
MTSARTRIKRAKPLDPEAFERLLAFALQRSRVPASDKLKLLLSFKAGLRACEIARMRVTDLFDADGRPARNIEVFGGKYGKHRTVPMHKEIREALLEFRKAHPTARYVAISTRKQRGRPAPMSSGALTQWFFHLYRAAGFKGASGHSGRRTFGTQLAHRLAQHQRTLVDVQMLLGHSRLDTTAMYIEPNQNTFDMINSL